MIEMKKVIFVITFFFTIILTAQVIGKIETVKGKELLVYPYMQYSQKVHGVIMGSQFLYYHDIDGKERKIAQRKIKKFILGDRVLIRLKVWGNLMRLHEVITENDKYMLTSYHDNHRELFYVYDKNDMSVVEYKINHSEKKKEDFTNIKLLKKYFKCNDMFDIINSNIKNTLHIF